MKIFIPVSISALNNSIDADLIFTAAHGTIRKDNVSSILALRGGTDINTGAGISLYGYDTSDGEIVFRVPGPATPPVTSVDAMKIEGHDNADAGHLNLLSHRIIGLAEATTANDALRLNAWDAWAPTLVWGGGTPAGTVSTSYRYTRIGKTIYFTFYYSATDSNACTSLTFTLPVAAANDGAYTICSGAEYDVATWRTLLPILVKSESKVYCNGFTAGTDGAAISILVNGFYEVA